MRLDQAAAKYGRGEITVEQWDAAKQQYAPDYHAIMMTLARLNRPPTLAQRIRSWLATVARQRVVRSR